MSTDDLNAPAGHFGVIQLDTIQIAVSHCIGAWPKYAMRSTSIVFGG